MESRELSALVRIKYFAKITDYLLIEKSPVSASFAIVVCDSTTESVLRLLLQKLAVHVNSEELVPTLIERAEGKLKKPEIRFSDLSRLHVARNKVLHEQLIFDETEARTICANAIECIRSIVRLGFGIDWNAVTLGELIADPLVKALYVGAEKGLRAGKSAEAIVSLVACFEQARNNEQLRIYGSGVSIAEAAADAAVASSPDNAALHAVLDYAKAVREDSEILKLGLNYKEYRKFADLDPNNIHPRFLQGAPVFTSETDAITYWNSRIRSRAELRSQDTEWIGFAFRFVENAVISWQLVSRVNLVDMFLGAITAVGTALQKMMKS